MISSLKNSASKSIHLLYNVFVCLYACVYLFIYVYVYIFFDFFGVCECEKLYKCVVFFYSCITFVRPKLTCKFIKWLKKI